MASFFFLPNGWTRKVVKKERAQPFAFTLQLINSLQSRERSMKLDKWFGSDNLIFIALRAQSDL
jgi:hypothetical protein